MKKDELKGKVVVITGSSRGIGKAIALELAKRGGSVVLNGRDESRLKSAEAELRKVNKKVAAVCCDVATIEGAGLLIDRAKDRFGRIDILVNNVGISMRGNFADLNPEVFKTIFKNNVLGFVYPSIPAIKYLRETKGSIVFISSLAGIRGLPLMSAYCSSKMAIRAIAESIRIEETGNGLHVGLILVGLTERAPGKEAIAADGKKMVLKPRRGKEVDSAEKVALAVVKNISKRKFITVLTSLGKWTLFLQALSPMLVERLILKNMKEFEKKNR